MGNADELRLRAVDAVAEDPASGGAMRVHRLSAVRASSAGTDAGNQNSGSRLERRHAARHHRAIAPEHGLALIELANDKDRTYRVSYGELFAPIVKSIQEQPRESARPIKRSARTRSSGAVGVNRRSSEASGST
jgi:hypothetical protein